MVAVMHLPDLQAERFKAADARLQQWGRERWRSTQALGLPSVSNFAQIIAHVRRQEREERKRRKDLRKKINDQRRQQQSVDCKDVAMASGSADLELTAQGNETRSVRPKRIGFSSAALTVEYVVRGLPAWMQTPLYRTYVHQQPHRIAAQELQMSESDYRSRWRAGVEEVGRLLVERGSGVVR